MSEFPLVSIITPTKNRSALLRETILSVIAQTYPNWEMLIIDDESTDNTAEMLKEFSSEKRIVYAGRSGEIAGAQSCRNEGINMARGTYIIFLDSDDLLAKTCLEKRVQTMSENDELDFAAFPTIIFGPEYPGFNTYWNLPNGKDDISNFLNWDPTWGIISVIWKKSKIQLIGRFEESVLSFQDIDIHFRGLINDLNYKFIGGDADSFVREHEAERIGIHCEQRNHLYSHEQLLEKIYKSLSQKEKLTEQRKTSLAGFYFRVSSFWVQQNNLKKAKELWKTVSVRKLVPAITYYSAALYLSYLSMNRKEDISVITRLRFIFYKLLPREFFIKNRTWKQLKKP